MTNQEQCDQAITMLQTLEKIALEGRNQAGASGDPKAVIAADKFHASIINAHAAGVKLCGFIENITPSFGGK